MFSNIIFIRDYAINLSNLEILYGAYGHSFLNIYLDDVTPNTLKEYNCEEFDSYECEVLLQNRITPTFRIKLLQEFLGYIISHSNEARKIFVITCDSPAEFRDFFRCLFSAEFISTLDPKNLIRELKKGSLYDKYINLYEYMPNDGALNDIIIQDLLNLKHI